MGTNSDKDSHSNPSKMSVKGQTAAGDSYWGGQVKRGGGEFIAKSNIDVDAAINDIQSMATMAELPPAQTAEHDELTAPFAPLYQAVEGHSSLVPIVDALKTELEKGPSAKDDTCAFYVNVLATSGAPIGNALHALLLATPIDKIAGPQMRAAIEKAT
jgi:hypothetical protein